MANKELALQEWARTNPFLTDYLMFDFLGGNNGECSISPLFSENDVKKYIDGSKVKEYTFALQVIFSLSDTTDEMNTDNMFTIRLWQDWIEEQEKIGNYPDFGSKCSDFRLENLNNMPQMAMRFDNNMAKYQFFAKLTYREEK